jgi:hypothetical protein
MPSLIVFRSSVNTIIYPYTYPIRATDSLPDEEDCDLVYLSRIRKEKITKDPVLSTVQLKLN